MKKKIKALSLLSGGLDSVLAIKLLEEQGIEVTGLSFVSNFYNAERAKIAAKELGIELKVVDISNDIIELVKNPPHGYGKNLNPCIDCHGFMIKKAGEIAKKEGYDIVATGEVLGQRPMSQNRQALRTVKEISGVEVLRPLSGKLIEETEPEREGLIKRHRLLDISGRSRDRQLELARKYNLKEYAPPAGGCILTDPEFSGRLLKLMDYWPDFNFDDVELLKNGRVFWFTDLDDNRILAVIGRNKDENQRLNELARGGDFVVELKKEMGPTTLIRLRNNKLEISKELNLDIPEELSMAELKMLEKKEIKDILNTIGLLTGYYSTKARGEKIDIKIEEK